MFIFRALDLCKLDHPRHSHASTQTLSLVTHQACTTVSLRTVREILSEITDPLSKHRFTWSFADSVSSSLGGRLFLCLCGGAPAPLSLVGGTMSFPPRIVEMSKGRYG